MPSTIRDVLISGPPSPIRWYDGCMSAADPMPIPPRFRWLKRLGAAAILLVLLLLGLRLWWGWYEQRQLDAVVNAIAATGEPIRFADMKLPHVPDADNAAHYYRQALARWPKVHGQLIIDTKWYDDPKHHSDPITDNAGYLKKCAAVFALLDKAAAAPGCDWHVKLTHPAISILLPRLSRMRDLMRLISDALRRAHARGDDALALQLINDEWDLSQRVSGPPSAMIGDLVGISMRSRACADLKRLTPTLRISAAAASPRQVHAMIARLLDARPARRDFINAYIGERWMAFDTAKWATQNASNLSSLNGPTLPTSWWTQAWLWCYRPVLVADIRTLLRSETHMIAIARAADSWPAFQRHDDMDARIQTLAKRPWLHPVTVVMMPDLSDAVGAHFKQLTTRRLAAVALAIRLYQVDHGKRPATQAQLVPAYLPAVPRDPMAAGNAPLRYLPRGVVPQWPASSAATPQQRAKLAGKRFAEVYSVGNDGRDDDGKCFYNDDGRVDVWSDNDAPCDAVFVLDPKP